MNGQMKKGILDVCILHLVATSKEIYGYDLMKTMKIHFPEIDESTFYAVLRRLHKNGMTSSFFSDVSGGPPRKYYQITPAGEAWLAESMEAWRNLQQIARALGIE